MGSALIALLSLLLAPEVLLYERPAQHAYGHVGADGAPPVEPPQDADPGNVFAREGLVVVPGALPEALHAPLLRVAEDIFADRRRQDRLISFAIEPDQDPDAITALYSLWHRHPEIRSLWAALAPLIAASVGEHELRLYEDLMLVFALDTLRALNNSILESVKHSTETLLLEDIRFHMRILLTAPSDVYRMRRTH